MPDGGRLTIRTAALAVSDAPPPRLRGEPGRYVCLVVSDTGIGMSDEVKRHIFEPFFTTKPTGQGTGLGLATVFGIVTQAGGQITVDSAPGRGTTFTILLPAARDRRAAARVEAGAPPWGGHETVLLAEDQADVRRLTRRMLERLGYTVLEADSGPAALALAAQHNGPVHLVVTDVVMPGYGGRDLAARLRGVLPGIRVLYMSGYAHDQVHVAPGGADAPTSGGSTEAFLHKPFSLTALGAKVRELLDADARHDVGGV
jgi:CheY-like chemotaxis protein